MGIAASSSANSTWSWEILVESSVTPVCPHFPLIPAASAAGSTFPATGAAPLPGVQGNLCSEHLRPQTPRAGGSRASGRTRGDKQTTGFHDNQFRCHRWRDAGGDAPEEGTGMLHCQGFASSREWQLWGWKSPLANVRRSWEWPQPACCAWLSSGSELTSVQSPGRGVTAATGLGGAAWARTVLHTGETLSPSGTCWAFVSFLLHSQPWLQFIFLNGILIRYLNIGQNVFPAAGTPRNSPRKVEREEK